MNRTIKRLWWTLRYGAVTAKYLLNCGCYPMMTCAWCAAFTKQQKPNEALKAAFRKPRATEGER